MFPSWLQITLFSGRKWNRWSNFNRSHISGFLCLGQKHQCHHLYVAFKHFSPHGVSLLPRQWRSHPPRPPPPSAVPPGCPPQSRTSVWESNNNIKIKNNNYHNIYNNNITERSPQNRTSTWEPISLFFLVDVQRRPCRCMSGWMKEAEDGRKETEVWVEVGQPELPGMSRDCWTMEGWGRLSMSSGLLLEEVF